MKHIPVIIVTALYLVHLGSCIARHGKKHEECKPENAWTSLLAIFLILALLYWGGFYDVWFKH